MAEYHSKLLSPYCGLTAPLPQKKTKHASQQDAAKLPSLDPRYVLMPFLYWKFQLVLSVAPYKPPCSSQAGVSGIFSKRQGSCSQGASGTLGHHARSCLQSRLQLCVSPAPAVI